MCNQTGDSPAVAEGKKQIAKSEDVVLSLGPAIYYDWGQISLYGLWCLALKSKNKSIIYCSYLTRLLWEVKLYMKEPC